MKNKKGFTLIELLAVIALLAILIVMAVPAILKLFSMARMNAFINEAQSIYKTAYNTYSDNYLKNNVENKKEYCNGESTNKNKLDLSGSEKKYKVVFDDDGKVTLFSVYDTNYAISISGTDLTVSSIVEDDVHNYSSSDNFECN